MTLAETCELLFVETRRASTVRFFDIEFNSANRIHAMHRTTASLRASATFAFIMPARLASRIAQLLSAPPWIGRVKMTWAASCR